MLRQYLSFLLITAITAATVNAGCCALANGEGSANTGPLTCEQRGGYWTESDCTP
ncbi:hypothetical protein PTTW11_04708 [Pyrenophora teres f. teres]|uniref:Uncharacterized protein n=1 Tax=Pyrenophora teres f. teres TaxID=97479 RepID=A0A6S6W0V2_9PLEO|nr:hypothetical protein PTTW11_04708 [Pyrenophora teres f. teres]